MVAKECHSNRGRVEIRSAVPGIAWPWGEQDGKSMRAAWEERIVVLTSTLRSSSQEKRMLNVMVTRSQMLGLRRRALLRGLVGVVFEETKSTVWIQKRRRLVQPAKMSHFKVVVEPDAECWMGESEDHD